MKKTVLTVAILMASVAWAGIIFEDNFNGYDYDSGARLGAQNTAWQGAGANIIGFANWIPGKAYFQNGSWGDNTLRQAYTNVGVSDFTVSVDAFQHDAYIMEWYATARATDTQYIAAGVVIGDGIVYARLIDSAGYASLDYRLGAWDGTKAVSISLTVEGDTAVANFSHNGQSQELNYTTSILGGTNAGFGGKYAWNYPLGTFDNFKVVPEPATMALLALGGMLIRRKK